MEISFNFLSGLALFSGIIIGMHFFALGLITMLNILFLAFLLEGEKMIRGKYG